MEELFEQGKGELSRGDINLLLFPHLKEFLVVDLRCEHPNIQVLNANDIFDNEFFDHLEQEFGKILREETEHPFSHLMGISMQVEELMRESGMMAILRRLTQVESDEEQPLVAVFIMGGSALVSGEKGIDHIMHSLFDETADSDIRTRCARLMAQFIARERQVSEELERSELREALQEESPNFFTLWQQRN